MQIKTNSLEWHDIKTELLRQARSLRFERDIRHMIKNVDKRVTELSKEEVIARRGSKYKSEILIKQINDDIVAVEEYIVVAALIG